MEKKLFCINLSDEKNTSSDDQILVARRISDVHKERLMKRFEKNSQIINDGSPRKPIVIGLFVFMTLFIVTFTLFISMLGENESFSEAYKKAPYLPYISLLSLLTTTLFWKHIARNTKNIVESDNFKECESQLEVLFDISDKELNNPEESIMIEVFCCQYKVVDGTPKAIKPKGYGYLYENVPKKMYIRESNLYIADIEQVVEIPLHSIKQIEEINKKVKIPSWLWKKEVPFNKPPYKKYKIKHRNNELTMKSYCIVHIEVDNQSYMIMIPPYDIDSFANLTGVL
jgi:hypothetical protein